MLYDYYKYFINYLIILYGGSYEIKNNQLFLYSGADIFKVSLFDGSRFDKWTFYHKNQAANDGCFHRQGEYKDLEYGLFRCFTHSFNKTYSIPYDKEDWSCFRDDALKYKILEM